MTLVLVLAGLVVGFLGLIKLFKKGKRKSGLKWIGGGFALMVVAFVVAVATTDVPEVTPEQEQALEAVRESKAETDAIIEQASEEYERTVAEVEARMEKKEPVVEPTLEPEPIVEPVKINNPTISKAEFDQIKNGMSYEEVVAIIGSEGEMLSEVGSPGEQFYTVMYMWDGEGDLGANANLMFQDGKLNTKSQFGLK